VFQLLSYPGPWRTLSDGGARGFHYGIRLSLILLGLFHCLIFSQSASACDEIPAGKFFWIRLLDPVASYSSKPGTAVRAVLIQSPECASTPVFPGGLEVEGQIV
jgi:hypothetical protein